MFFSSCYLCLLMKPTRKKPLSPPGGDTLQYRLLQPENMKKSEKYPLVLFLHGAGERGNDNERQLTHGGQMF